MELENLPIINGIMYSNGYVDSVAISVQAKHSRTVCKQEHKVLSSNDLDYTYAYPSSELIIESMNCKITCGGGSYGGDGFVLATALDSGEMLWLASFDESNPFVNIYEKNHHIYVTNNCNEIWQIDVVQMNCVEINIVHNGLY